MISLKTRAALASSPLRGSSRKKDFGLVNKRGRDKDLLLHPLRVLLYPLIALRPYAEQVEKFVRAPFGDLPVKVVQVGHEMEVLAPRERFQIAPRIQGNTRASSLLRSGP